VEAYVAEATNVVGPGSSLPIERSSSQAVMPRRKAMTAGRRSRRERLMMADSDPSPGVPLPDSVVRVGMSL
jgi:hypothetical protein